MIDEFNEYLFDYTSKISIDDIRKAKKKLNKKKKKKLKRKHSWKELLKKTRLKIKRNLQKFWRVNFFKQVFSKIFQVDLKRLRLKLLISKRLL